MSDRQIKATVRFGRYTGEAALSKKAEAFPYLQFTWKSKRPVIFNRVLDDAREFQQARTFAAPAWDDVKFAPGLTLGEKEQTMWLVTALNYLHAAAASRRLNVTISSDFFQFEPIGDIVLPTGDLRLVE